MLPADMDQDALDDMYDIFGDGADYEYAMFSHQVRTHIIGKKVILVQDLRTRTPLFSIGT
jgi:hypothetical protein